MSVRRLAMAATWTWAACTVRAAEQRDVSFGPFNVSMQSNGTFALEWDGEAIIAKDYAVRHVRFDPEAVGVHVARDEQRTVVTTRVRGDLAFLERRIVLRDSDCIITWRLALQTDEPAADAEIGFYLPRRLLRDANFYALDYMGRYFGRQPQPVQHPMLVDVDGSLRFRMELACSQGPGGAYAGWSFTDERATKNAWRMAVTYGANPPSGRLEAVARFDFAPPKENWAALRAGRQDKGNIYVDYLDLVEHPFTVTLERGAKYVVGDSPVTVACNYLSTDSAPRRLDLSYIVSDYYGRQVAAGRLPLPHKGVATARRAVKVRTRTFGMCRLTLNFRDRDSGYSGSRETVWAVLPTQRARAEMPSSMFGAHVPSTEYYYGLAQAMGVKWSRLHRVSGADTAWSTVEPQKGRWTWPGPLPAQQLASRHKITLLGVLGSPPAWTRPAFEHDFQAFMRHWTEYVRRTVRAYEGRIEYWEVWNEPYYAFAGRPADYAELLRHTYEAAKAVDPACTIVGTCGPPQTMPAEWYALTLKPFGLTYQDAVSGHLYPPRIGLRGSELNLRRRIHEIREEQTVFGIPKPIWNTEAGISPVGSYFRHTNHRVPSRGYGDDERIPAEDVAEYLVRQYVPCLAEGVRYFYYALDGGPDYGAQLCEYDGTPMPACVAYAQLAATLQTAEYVRDLSLPEGFQGYIFADGYVPIAVLWGTDLAPWESVELQVALPRGAARALDLMGNEAELRTGKRGRLTVTGRPLYVVGDRLTVASMDQAFAAATLSE
ncbi:MAG: hypothetical protein ACE5O2_00385 [Armatimonadota bacterium]